MYRLKIRMYAPKYIFVVGSCLVELINYMNIIWIEHLRLSTKKWLKSIYKMQK